MQDFKMEKRTILTIIGISLIVILGVILLFQYLTIYQYKDVIPNEDNIHSLREKYKLDCLVDTLDSTCKRLSGNYGTDGVKLITDGQYECWSNRNMRLYINLVSEVDKCKFKLGGV